MASNVNSGADGRHKTMRPVASSCVTPSSDTNVVVLDIPPDGPPARRRGRSRSRWTLRLHRACDPNKSSSTRLAAHADMRPRQQGIVQ